MSDDTESGAPTIGAGADTDFRLASVEFGDLVDNWFAHFTFGPDYKLSAPLPTGVDIEEAIAVAAESAAADFRLWAQEAEDLAASTRAGGLRQPPAAEQT